MRAKTIVLLTGFLALLGLSFALTIYFKNSSANDRPEKSVAKTTLKPEQSITNSPISPSSIQAVSGPAPGLDTEKLGGHSETTINFQHLKTDTPAGCLADTGLVFADRGNGQQYGWIGKRATESRERGVHPDKKLDTLIHLTKGYSTLGPHQNAPSAPGGTPGADHVWAIVVPNGTYRVYLAMGDPTATDHRNNVMINGIQHIDKIENNNFDYHDVIVIVEQGIIEVRAGSGAENPKVCYIIIRRTEDPL